MSMDIEIYAAEGDPILPIARESITAWMQEMGLLPCWTENISNLPLAIFADGKEIWRDTNGNGPSKEELLRNNGIKRTRANSRMKILRKYFSFFLALLIAFFPKCPFCWAAYMSAFGLLGADAIPYRSWYLPLSIGLLLLNILAVYKTGGRHQYKPLVLTIAGAIFIIVNRLWIQSNGMMVTGLILIIAGSAWNSLPKLMTASVKNLFVRKEAGA